MILKLERVKTLPAFTPCLRCIKLVRLSDCQFRKVKKKLQVVPPLDHDIRGDSVGGGSEHSSMIQQAPHLKYSYAFMSSRFKKKKKRKQPDNLIFSPDSQFVTEALCQKFVIFQPKQRYSRDVILSNFVRLDKTSSRTTGDLTQLFSLADLYIPQLVTWLCHVKLLMCLFSI